MKIKEIIEIVENANELYSVNMAHRLIKDKATLVAVGLQPSDRRWYSISTAVYRCDDGYVGVRGVSKSNVEQQTYEDIGITCKAFEMKEIMQPTYIPMSDWLEQQNTNKDGKGTNVKKK
jgi:hypothetical protein